MPENSFFGICHAKKKKEVEVSGFYLKVSIKAVLTSF